MELVIVSALIFLAVRVWTRLSSMQDAIDRLKARIDGLEDSRAIAPAAPAHTTQAPAAQTAPTATSAPPPLAPPALRPQPASATPAAPPASGPTTPAPLETVAPKPPEKLVTRVPAPTPAAPAAPAPAAAASVQMPPREPAREALETRIGSRWLLYIGIAAIVVGVAYFEKLAIDNEWVTETMRVVQGVVVGLLLVGSGLMIVRRGYRLYGQLVSGAGIAIQYVSIYAAFNFYHLVSQPVAFALMSGVTAMAAWLADRQRSQGLALAAICGGFATPFLLPSNIDAEAALFTYDAFLIAGTLALSRRRDWPTLNVASYGFTVLTFFAWALRFYTPSTYLTTELFLTLFCGMFLIILRGIQHSSHRSAPIERAILASVVPGYYLLSLGNLESHSTALLIFLVVLSLVGVIVATRTNAWVRLAFWAAAAVPLLLWSGAHGGRTWLVAGLAAWSAIYLLNLAGLLEATIWKARRFGSADIALLHLNGLVSYAGAYLLIEPVRLTACAALAAALAVANGAVALLLARRWRDEALHFAALAFTLLTIAIGVQFEGVWQIAGWAAEGAAIIWLGLRERREWLRIGGLVVFGMTIARLMPLLFSAPRVGELLLLNSRAACSLFVVALTYAVTWAHRRAADRPASHTEVGVGLLIAKLLLFLVAASEIAAYWSLHAPPPFAVLSQILDAALVTGAVIMWLGLRRQQEWLRAAGALVVILAANWLLAIQLAEAPKGYVAVLNTRAATGVLAVLVLYALSIAHRRLGAHIADVAVNIAILTTGASLLTLSLLTSEIDAFWAARGAASAWSMPREALHVMAWSAIAGLLVWRGLTSQRTWVRAIGGVLLTVGLARLLRLQSAGAASAYVVVANARVLASIMLIALLYGLAHLYRTADVYERRYSPATILSLAANVLTLTLFTSEITAYWHVHDLHRVSASAAATNHFAREMMLSITWAAYATVLVVIGLRRNYAPIRYFAITVFLITIVKVFALDIAELDRLYRVLSIIGLGITLLVTAYFYQKRQIDRSRSA